MGSVEEARKTDNQKRQQRREAKKEAKNTKKMAKLNNLRAKMGRKPWKEADPKSQKTNLPTKIQKMVPLTQSSSNIVNPRRRLFEESSDPEEWTEKYLK